MLSRSLKAHLSISSTNLDIKTFENAYLQHSTFRCTKCDANRNKAIEKFGVFDLEL